MRSFLKNPENRNHVRALFLIFALSTILAVMIGYRDPYYRYGIRLADKQDLSHTDYSILKEGYYCGEGGVHCNHFAGFIYYTTPLTDQEAMQKAGFEYDAAESEYSKGGEYAQIVRTRKYKNGFLLYYSITGAA